MNEAERDALDWAENHSAAGTKAVVTSRATAWTATVAAAMLALFLSVSV
jgi:hypothetical protein